MRSLKKWLMGVVFLVAASAATADVLSFMLGSVTALVNVLNIGVSGLKVATSQVAVAAKAQINADIVVAQGAMAARGTLASTLEQIAVYNNFGFESGQGPQTCAAVGLRDDVDVISQSREKLAFTAMATAGRAPFQREFYETQRATSRMGAYCSADEHNLGLCKSRFDGMAGISTNFGKLSLQPQFTSRHIKAAEDFVAELVPPPLPLRANVSCESGSACQGERVAAMRVDALSSMVAVSMAAQLSSRVGEKTFAAKR